MRRSTSHYLFVLFRPHSAWIPPHDHVLYLRPQALFRRTSFPPKGVCARSPQRRLTWRCRDPSFARRAPRTRHSSAQPLSVPCSALDRRARRSAVVSSRTCLRTSGRRGRRSRSRSRRARRPPTSTTSCTTRHAPPPAAHTRCHSKAGTEPQPPRMIAHSPRRWRRVAATRGIGWQRCRSGFGPIIMMLYLL